MNNKVSVCLPVYNAEKYVQKTIDSILRQTYSDFELVILENGSTDNSLNMIMRYDDPRIKIFTNKEVLPSTENWNKCIHHASGDLIALYHSDDIYEPNMLEEEVHQFNKYPNLGAVFTRGYIIDENDTVTGEMFIDDPLKGPGLVDLNMAFFSYIESGKGSFICPTTMIPKKVYESVGYYDGKSFTYYFDYDLYFRIMEKHPVKILQDKLIRCRIHKEQGSVIEKRSRGVTPHDFYLLFNKFINSPALTLKLDKKLINGIYRAEKDDYYLCAANAFKKNDIKCAAEMLQKAVGIKPGLFDKIVNVAVKSGNIKMIAGLVERIKG